MYSIAPVFALGLALAGNAVADFSVYSTYAQGIRGGTTSRFNLYSSTPSCDDAEDTGFGSSSDLSSGSGIRCDGNDNGCTGSGGSINELEMRSGDMHWTYYGDSGDLVDTDSNLIGNCYIDQSDDYSCNLVIGLVNGNRILYCETDQTPEGLSN